MSPQPDRLDSWKEIADYLGKGVTTVRRWEREEGLPVRRHEHAKRGSVVAYKHEVDVWLQSRTRALPEDPPPDQPDVRRRRPLRWLAAAATVASIVVGIAWTGRDPLNAEIEHLILTSDPGGESSISFAPGGGRFAYAGVGDAGVFVKQVGVEPAHRLFSDPAKWICCVRWSPNGRVIAISYQLPARGPQYRIGLIDSAGKWIRELGVGGPGMAWRKDGQALLYVAAESAGDPTAVFEQDLGTGQRRQISFPPAGSWGDILGVPSPDGSQLALMRYPSVGKGDIYLARYGGKEAERLTHLESWVLGVGWLPDGDHVVFGGNAGSAEGIFLLNSKKGAEPRLIPGTQGVHRYPDIVRLADGAIRIGYSYESWNMDLAIFDPANGGSRPVALSTKGEETPSVSDTGQLAFMSQRSGAANLWVCDLACQEPRQITQLHEPNADMTPRWSPDGRRIAFIARENGKQSLRISGAGGEDPMILANGFDVGDPSWSADGRFLYYRCNRSGRQEIWKAPADGRGEARQITQGGGVEAFESADGRWLYLTHAAENAPLMRLRAGEKIESPVKEVGTVRRGFWRTAGTFIYFWKDDGYNLARFDTATGQTTRVMSVPKNTRAFSFSANAAGLVVWSHQGPYFDDLYAVDIRPHPFWRLW